MKTIFDINCRGDKVSVTKDPEYEYQMGGH